MTNPQFMILYFQKKKKDNVLEETHVLEEIEEIEVHESKENSINYACNNQLWD